MAILLTGVTSKSALAQEKTPLPPGPVLKKTEDFCTWQITYAYKDDKTLPGNVDSSPLPSLGQLNFHAPRLVTLTRTRPLWHCVSVDVDGTKIEQWSAGKGQFLFVPGSSTPLIGTENLAPGLDAFAFLPDYSRVDFPDMEWISAKTYKGTEKSGTTNCFLFEQGDLKAWIDIETRFPVRWQKGENVRQFLLLPPPTGKLALPPVVAELQKQIDKTIKAGSQMPPKGG